MLTDIDLETVMKASPRVSEEVENDGWAEEDEKSLHLFMTGEMEGDFQDEDVHFKIREALKEGNGLVDCMGIITEELKDVQGKLLIDYVEQTPELIQLHYDSRALANRLLEMENGILDYLGDLGFIADGIKSLEKTSSSIHNRLENRKMAQNYLIGSLHDLMVTPKFVSVLVEGKIDETYVSHVVTLSKKIGALEFHRDEMKTLSYEDASPGVYLLRSIVGCRIKSFLFSIIDKLAKPNTNFQIIQQNVLSKYRFFNVFLRDNFPIFAEEVRNHYCSVVSRIYEGYMFSYVRNVIKTLNVQDKEIDGTFRSRVVKRTGSYSSINWSSFSDIFTNPNTNNINTNTNTNANVNTNTNASMNSNENLSTSAPNEIGKKISKSNTPIERLKILKDLEIPPIIPHVALEKNDVFPREELFRSVHKILMDSYLSEFSFLCHWFYLDFQSSSIDRSYIISILDSLFSKVLHHCHHFFLTTVLSDCKDFLALLLMLGIIFHNQSRCQKSMSMFAISFSTSTSTSSSVPTVSSMFSSLLPGLDNHLNMDYKLVWKRLKSVFSINVESLKIVSPPPSSSSSSSSAAALGSAGRKSYLHPHMYCRKYAEYSSAAHVVNQQIGSNTLSQMFDIFRHQTEIFLLKMADQFNNPEEKSIYLINNYCLIFNMMMEYQSINDDEELSDDANRFQYLIDNQIKILVEMEIIAFFPGLVDFAFSKVHSKEGVKVFLKSFGLDWKKKVADMNSNILNQFPDFGTGTCVLKETLATFVHYYSLLEANYRTLFVGNAMNLVSTSEIAREIRKFTNFDQ